jgi:hypothetical protein
MIKTAGTEGQVGRHGAATAVTVVNGPEDVPENWFEIDWDQVEDDVRRLLALLVNSDGSYR